MDTHKTMGSVGPLAYNAMGRRNGQSGAGRGGVMSQLAAQDASGGYVAPSILTGFLNIPWTGNSSLDKSVSAMGTGTNVGATISGNALVVVGNGAEQTIQWGIAEPNNLGRAANAAFTIEAWVYWTSLYNSTAPCTFVHWFIGAPTFQEQHIFSFNGNQGGIGHNYTQVGTAKVPQNTWSHVAMVRPTGSGTQTASFYIDGVLAGTKSVGNGNAAGGYVKTGVTVSNVLTNAKVGSIRLTMSALYTANFTPPTNPMT